MPKSEKSAKKSAKSSSAKTPTVKKTASSEIPVKKPVRKTTAVKSKSTKEAAQDKKVSVAKSGQYIYAVGRRKTSTAKIRLYSGGGEFVVNDQPLGEYFSWFEWEKKAVQPLQAVGGEKKFDLRVVVSGSGLSAQSEAIAHGVARALVKQDETYKKVLKSQGFLTRDPRMKERKKPGLKGARRAPQWSKR